MPKAQSNSTLSAEAAAAAAAAAAASTDPKQRPRGHLQHGKSKELTNKNSVVKLGLAFQHALLLLNFGERNAGDFDPHAFSIAKQHACSGDTPSIT